MVQDTPSKLKHDAIVEAVFEVRFDLPPASVPEIFVGRLASAEAWRGYNQVRLPIADIPVVVRRSDENLRYQPTIEVVHPDGNRSIRIGEQVIAYSRRAPYPGWDVFGLEIEDTIEALFSVENSISVTRLGLRYMNALRSDLHTIDSISDLNIELRSGGDAIVDHFNFNYTLSPSDNISGTVRIATKDFVQGQIPLNSTLLVDIDMSSRGDLSFKDSRSAADWARRAHDEEKRLFFGLLTPEKISQLID